MNTVNQKLHPLLVRAVAQSLVAIFRDKQYADKIIEQALKWNPKAGSRDRAFIAETTYECVRHFRLYEAVIGKTPKTEDDFWKIIAVHLCKVEIWLPDWIEFRGMNYYKIHEQLSKFEEDRRIRESVPDWLDSLGEAELGENWETILANLNLPAKVVLRANTLKTNKLELQQLLLSENFETEFPGDDFPDALMLKRRGSVFKSQAFKSGFFEVQDASSQLVAPFLDPKPGMRVVDACAGGGGKTLHIAALMQGKGSIIALDTLEWKLGELRTRANRAGVTNVETRHIENSKVIKRMAETADRLLLDVPCSGLGVLRRNPDSKWKLTPEFIENLKVTQQEILQSYSKILKPGGRMVYATCSILPSENEQQVEKFLASEAGQKFKLLEEKHILPEPKGFDGFFMAAFERV